MRGNFLGGELCTRIRTFPEDGVPGLRVGTAILYIHLEQLVLKVGLDSHKK